LALALTGPPSAAQDYHLTPDGNGGYYMEEEPNAAPRYIHFDYVKDCGAH
jgi:hypothetical protein